MSASPPPPPPSSTASGPGSRGGTIAVVATAAVILVTVVGVGLFTLTRGGVTTGVEVAAENDEPPPVGAEESGSGATDAETPTEIVDDDADLAVFLCDGRSCPEISDTDRDAVEAALDEHPAIDRVRFESSAEAYVRFREEFSDRPDLTETIDEDTLPESFHLWLRDPSERDRVIAELAELPGVDDITDRGAPADQADPPEITPGDLEAAYPVGVYLCVEPACPAPSQAEIEALHADLEAHPLVAEAVFESREEAYDRFVEVFEDQEELLEMLDPETLPESFRVRLADPQAYLDDPDHLEPLFTSFATRPEVDEVVDLFAQRPNAPPEG